MDEKTEELRDIFLDVTEEATVTETQEESRGSLRDRQDVDEAITAVIDEIRDTFDVELDLSTEVLVELVRAFYDGSADSAIADQLEVDRATVRRARLALHLVRDSDRDGSLELAELLEQAEAGKSVPELADSYDVSESTIRDHLDVAVANRRSRQVNQRFRAEFDSIFDADLATRLTESVHEDGLEEATEGLETNVSF